MIIFLSLFLIFCPLATVWSELVSQENIPASGEKLILDMNAARIVFLARQGEPDTALRLYQKMYKEKRRHNYLLLQQISLAILLEGAAQSDPEIQLLSLFGASMALHEQAYEIIENSLKNRNPLIQLIALQALGRLHQERADQALFRALGSDQLALRYEALKLLCEKKHEQATSQVESLLYKLPRRYIPIIPPLLAMLETPESTRLLQRLLQDPSAEVRLSVILSIAKLHRDDFLPQIRKHSLHGHYSELEACAYTLGILEDEYSIQLLQRLSRSQFPTVAIAASLALLKLGKSEALDLIEEMAVEGDLFAIASLADFENSTWTLVPLMNHKDKLVRLNAILALFAQKNPISYPYLTDILIRDERDLAYIPSQSPGKTMTAVNTISGAAFLFRDDPDACKDDLELRESILEDLRSQSDTQFLRVANEIFKKQQNDLVPRLTELLEEMGTPAAIQCLKQHQEKLGAPLVRHYCALALYHMDERSCAVDMLMKWVNNQSQTELIRFTPLSSEIGSNLYELTPEESSQLLIKVLEAFAIKQDEKGIALLVEAMVSGHQKNKYALAGLLLRATQ